MSLSGSTLEPSAEIFPLALAFAGGYADAAGYLLAKCFTGHITGNTILLAVSLASGDFRQSVVRFLAIVCFLSATAIAIRVAAAKAPAVWAAVLLLEALLVLAAPAGLLAAGNTSGGATCLIVCLCLALGLQNGAFRKYGSLSLHTTFLTGTVTSLLSAVEQTLPRMQAGKPKGNASVQIVLSIWIVFATGAGVAAVCVRQLGAEAVWLLEIPVLFLTIASWRSRQFGLALGNTA